MGSRKVLLVDDEPAYLEVMAKRLGLQGFATAMAPGGRQALAELAADPGIDVVLLDIKMPGMDGITALGEIRRLHPAVRVILLTAHATVESAVEGMGLGAFDYLFKPCDLQELTHLIKEARGEDIQGQAAI
ncbi:MAG: response regulator [Desulfovibrionaceae bacterium]|nr:response regulator [Desulfovibrionaceae bacterium]MBF0514449.1 response regulator [Desulfovibrionaceae bacterium]